ncbi:hypothetical protein [Arsenicicoccus sp. oral taxon 190]|uniref:hypothetical protein n=1 Tax=Arsenicicoccus sp. oral taxon 190 TaxID=1658671 RepID=UPI00067A01AD|nr:hypothetical protein [Arsenicicoccus sp. oral taxon 190]AKT51885.1 hypothetical protein ADJ73_12470 [Arsenicicoccus sp. oral taxon 190]
MRRSDVTGDRARRRAPWWLAAGAVLLLATAWGHANPTGSLLVHELLDHPVVHGVAGYLLLAWGLRSLVREPQGRLVVTILLAALGATVFGLVGLVISAGVHPGRDQQVVPAPRQAGVAAYAAEVTTDGDELSPVITVVLRHLDQAPSSRRWEAACVNEDDPGGALAGLRWEGPSRLVLRLESGREVAVPVEPATAAPREVVRVGRRCGRP